MSDATAKKEVRRKFQAIRGLRDLIPPETELWNRVEQTAREVFSTFGYGEIRLPIFEPTELFARSVGGETDIISKEMYAFELQAFQQIHHIRGQLLGSYQDPMRFTGYLFEFLAVLRSAWDSDRIERTESNKRLMQDLFKLYTQLHESIADDRVLQEADKHPVIRDSILDVQTKVLDVEVSPEMVSLRPEATASVCRAYIEHNMQQQPQPVKLYYMGPMFRRERPQKGRYRQFYQIGAEILGGTDAPGIDAEVIEMLMTFFDKVGLQGAMLYINSIGHNADNCRRGYVAKLKSALEKVKDQLGPDSQRRIDTNPLRVLDSKLESEQGIIATLPHIADHLCDDCKTHYAAVKRQLELRGVLYQENWRLVRGLDYYMRTTFEITAPGLGSQNAVCGGGRYDGLVELLGGPPTKGIGFAIGEDRLILSLIQHKPLPQRRNTDLVLAWLTPDAYGKAVTLAKNLRNHGKYVDLLMKQMRAGDAVRYADKIGAYFTLMIGEDELKSGTLTLKHMLRQEQISITESELLEHLSPEKMKGEKARKG